MRDRILVETSEGDFGAYIARPRTTAPAPALVVLHEVFGVNADMQQSCDELASAGFIAICPDLFWRQEPGLELSHWTPDEWAKGLALYQAYDRDAGVRDVVNALTFARSIEGASGRVGLTGYCLGGLLTFLTSARTRVDAAAAYYGGGIEGYVDEMAAVSDPLMMHLGDLDEFIDHEAQARIKRAAASSNCVVVHSYPDCSHAFARNTGHHFDPAAATLANARTRDFFHQHLGN